VLVSDIGLPDQTGFDLIEWVRGLPADAGGKMPTAALSAYTRDADRRSVLAAGFDVQQVGMLLLPSALASAAAMPLTAILGNRVDARVTIVIGGTVLLAGLYMLAGLSPQTGGDDLFWPLIVRGFGTVLMFMPLQLAALGPIPKKEVAAASGFFNLTRQLGGSIGVALLLSYREGDFNCLHQDLYGDHVFPLQVAFLLSEPGRDFTGGEFVMTEQRPRMQSRPSVVALRQGDAVVFAVNERPVQGQRGVYRVKMRHGVSRVHAGRRLTLGLIFHDGS
jgi:CheY-like chemotaxis protein